MASSIYARSLLVSFFPLSEAASGGTSSEAAVCTTLAINHSPLSEVTSESGPLGLVESLTSFTFTCFEDIFLLWLLLRISRMLLSCIDHCCSLLMRLRITDRCWLFFFRNCHKVIHQYRRWVKRGGEEPFTHTSYDIFCECIG
jgi:hypothetical protein